jgi:polyhydroxyalkanoate synthesis repressor PhaR
MKLFERSAARVQSGNRLTVLIKKYPNRRLYNSSSKAYVNLNDLAALIRKGEEIQVVDAKTGEDITRVVLTQIIVEDAKDAPTGLPLELLRQLIMASDRAGQEFIMWYLKSAFDTYEKVQGAVQDRLMDVRSAALSPLNLVKNLLTPPPEPKAEDELERLRRRVAELEQQQEPRARGKTAPDPKGVPRSRLRSEPQLRSEPRP